VRFLLPLLISLPLSTAWAGCNPFYLQLSEATSLRSVAAQIQEISGCNVVVDRSLEERLVEAPFEVSTPDSLAAKVGAKLVSSRNLYVFIPPGNSLSLSGRGRLVSVDLKGASIASINQVLSKLGASTRLSGDGTVSDIELTDIAVEDLIQVLELVSFQ
jgi:hypothetical protein